MAADLDQLATRSPGTQTMQRSLLCLSLGAMPEALHLQLQAGGWDLICAPDPRSAMRLQKPGLHRVGLLFIEQLSPTQCNQIEALFKADRSCEWVGVFSRDVQGLPGCVDLILGYLFDHHTLPVEPAHLLRTLGHAHGRACLQAAMRTAPDAGQRQTPSQSMVGNSNAIKLLMRQLRRVAATDAPVLIGGESGSGKELAAQAVHEFSRRHSAPFIAVNCGSIAGSLIQAELFGAVRGSYTGASRDRKGLIESADGGTLFLDEIADLPLDMQINLLRFLQEQTITPVGAAASIRIDVRVVAAANIDLQQAVEQGRFRHDLYYRLNVVPLVVPPLRERRDDIPLLAHHFYQRHRSEGNSRLRGFSGSALRAMLAYEWPGNVRELINRVRRAMVLSEGRLITPTDLGLATRSAPAADALGQIRIEAERVAVQQALARAQFNVTHAARELGVSRMTLYRMIDRHGITLETVTEDDTRTPVRIERRCSNS